MGQIKQQTTPYYLGFFAFQNLFRWLNWVLAVVLLCFHLTPKVPLIINAAAYSSIFVYNLIFTVWSAKIERWLKKQPAIVFVDVIFCTAILTAYGWRSPFTVYAFSPVVLAAYLNNVGFSFLIATLSAGGYLLSVAINGYTWLEMSRAGWLDSHLVQFADFYFVALFFSYPAALAQRLQETNKVLKENQAQARELALVKERQRIASDIHDGVIQQVYGLRLLLESALQQSKPTQFLYSLLEKAHSIAVRTAQDLRVVVDDLFQDDLALLPLGKLAYKIVNEYAATYGLTVDLDLKDYKKKLSPESKKAVYLILQEALNNIIKHAQAKKVKVVMETLRDKLYISVIDDGIGFKKPKNGRGLKTIEQRVEQLGGSWQLISAPGKGTRLNLVFPLATGKNETVKQCNRNDL